MKTNYLIKSGLRSTASVAGVTKKFQVLGDDREPLTSANILVTTRKGVGSTTDIDGFANVRLLVTDVVEISYIGYESVRYKATEIPERVILKGGIELDEVVVVAPPKVTPRTTLPPTPNNNKKINKAKKWIWIAALLIATGGGYYLYNRKK